VMLAPRADPEILPQLQVVDHLAATRAFLPQARRQLAFPVSSEKLRSIEYAHGKKG